MLAYHEQTVGEGDFSLLYQAVFWIAISSFWAKWTVIQVTIEYSPSTIGVVRWMAKSDHCRWVSMPRCSRLPGKMTYDQGFLKVPEGPGLGVELDLLEHYKVTEEKFAVHTRHIEEIRATHLDALGWRHSRTGWHRYRASK